MKIQELTITDGPWEAIKRSGEEGYAIIGDIGLDKNGIQSAQDVAYVWARYAAPMEAIGNARLMAMSPDMALVLLDIYKELKPAALSDKLTAQLQFIVSELSRPQL